MHKWRAANRIVIIIGEKRLAFPTLHDPLNMEQYSLASSIPAPTNDEHAWKRILF
jgi:hypothetical protein